MLEDLLEELGFIVAASLARLAPAWSALASIPFDLAVLDVNVAGETSFELARGLAQRGIPFMFSTGYGSTGLPPDLSDRHVLTKPFSASDLLQAIRSTLR